MSSQQTEAYNWKNLLNDFPIGKEVKYEKYVKAGPINSGYETISGKVVGFGIQIQGKNYYGGKGGPELVRIDQVIKPPSYNYQLQEGPDGKKVAIVNGYEAPLTPKVGGRRKTNSKSRKSKSRKSKSRKSRKTRK